MEAERSKRVRFEKPAVAGHETIELQQMVWRCEGCDTSRWMRAMPSHLLDCEVVSECEDCEENKRNQTWRIKPGPSVGFSEGAHHNED